jgi:hypothetical protein
MSSKIKNRNKEKNKSKSKSNLHPCKAPIKISLIVYVKGNIPKLKNTFNVKNAQKNII